MMLVAGTYGMQWRIIVVRYRWPKKKCGRRFGNPCGCLETAGRRR